MDLKNLISIRENLEDYETTSYGFKGVFVINSVKDLELVINIDKLNIREIYNITKNEFDLEGLEVGDKILLTIDLSNINSYYETFDDFVSSNKYSFVNDEFYIAEINYLSGSNTKNSKVSNFIILQEIISFLRKVCSHEKKSRDVLELFFHKPDKVCSIEIDYNETDLNQITIDSPVSELSDHIFNVPDYDTRRKLFSNELLNILYSEGYILKNLLNNWNKIETSYRSSFQIYLSEFSFEKIKISSQEDFHKLTDRIYSTVNKFSGYILAIPVAYVLIIRFFDFKGENLAKDSLLLIIGLLYFLIIWFVLLQNISQAYNTIEKEIKRFLGRISDHENLKEITDSLNDQIDKIIPKQRKKILLVQSTSLIILFMTIDAYIYIHLDKLGSLLTNIFGFFSSKLT